MFRISTTLTSLETWNEWHARQIFTQEIIRRESYTIHECTDLQQYIYVHLHLNDGVHN
jgi:hypothetical protein